MRQLGRVRAALEGGVGGGYFSCVPSPLDDLYRTVMHLIIFMSSARQLGRAFGD